VADIARFKITSISIIILCTAAIAYKVHSQTFDLDASRLRVSQIDSMWCFHLGDDPRWSNPDFDDRSWPVLHPQEDWATQGYPRQTELAWFRFHLRVPAHTQSLVLELPAIQKSFQLFSDGHLIAQVGALPPGPAHNVIGASRVFTLPVNSGEAPKEITVALRCWQDISVAGTRSHLLEGPVYAGSSEAVLGHFASDKASDLVSSGNDFINFIVLVIIAGSSVLLFWLTRERFYLWFAVSLLTSACYLPIDLASAHQAWGLYLTSYLNIGLDLLGLIAYVAFIVFGLFPSERKLLFLPSALAIGSEVGLVLILNHAISLKWGDVGYCLANIGYSLVLTLYLIRGWRAGNLSAKLLFFPFVVNAVHHVANNLGYVLLDLGFPFGRQILPDRVILLHDPFRVSLTNVIVLLSLLGQLAVLVYRFALTSRDQQRLAAALRAAHEIQNRLVPVHIPAFGGLHAEIAYRAAEEVGGDFCQILPRPDGSIFVAIGDVSGKGLQAAMLGAVAVGALRSLADEAHGPAAALERLNHVLLRTENAGFTTCLCLVLAQNGEVTIANAGHLSPYLDGVGARGGLRGLPSPCAWLRATPSAAA
jgi:hypothetical protein